jgi:hypothetical protein
MCWEIQLLDPVTAWLDGLDQASYEQVIAAWRVLQTEGPQLGRPLVDTLKGSSYTNMKELRPGSKGNTELRLLFAFDPRRTAIVLVAGDKAGNWNAWYRVNIPIADQRFSDHLEHLRGTRND